MTHVFINDNKVVEIKEIDADSLLGVMANYQAIFPIESFDRTPKVGWIWSAGKCFPDIKSITPRQARQAIVLSGLSLATIEGAMDLLPEPHASLAKIEWEYSTLIIRSNLLIEQMGLILGLTTEQIDDLFILGGKL